MKVKDLIGAFSHLDPELDVIFYSEDEALRATGHALRLMEVDTVSVTEAERAPDESGVPSLKLGKSALSESVAMIEDLSDFCWTRHEAGAGGVQRSTFFLSATREQQDEFCFGISRA